MADPYANARGLGQLIGTGLGLYSQNRQQEDAKQKQLQAAELLNKSYSMMNTDPDEANNAFIQAYQIAPGFVGKAVQGLGLQQKGVAKKAEEKPLSEYQRQSLELRRQQQEIDRLKMQQSEETSELRQQQLQAQIDKLQQGLKSDKESLQKSERKSENIAREAATLAREILNDDALSAATGTISTSLPVVRESTQDLINKAKRLESMLTYENLSLMSGVLTDRDISFLGQLASGLNVTDTGIKGSEEEIKNRLSAIAENIDRNLSGSGEGNTNNEKSANVENPKVINWSEL